MSPSLEEYCGRKIIAPANLEQKVQELKESGKTIATLNGSFDLMHAGHLEMIYQASLQADILLIAMNSDQSIRQYKSPLRPIIPLKYRMQMLSSLEMVDYITWFEETDPRELLKKVCPHVHVNGAEYGDNCIEAETVRNCGGRLHIVSLVPGLSTSNVIKKIIETCV
ncbi:MAG TPA: adenylyltransferase/cytidyltransferase family protein [Rhabdochlamydiaceae bacterium]|nr:adenylyltransferase/cytidyltransferase family protein [Rhabdochlamydiaceae bacterium]